MIFQQYYLECLSHASYLIGDETTGRAVVVDPQRDVSEYLADAEGHGLRIELAVETHFHADFLSGHLELAKATGAQICYSSVAETEFASIGVQDGERYPLGQVILEFLHTPGHTPESMSVVVYENGVDGDPFGVLTGDTLFIGDVGRPDLLSSIGMTEDQLADQLYDSLHGKLMILPDPTRVYPAHGAGSSCGKNLSTALSSTIGEQRTTNYALLAPDRATFVGLVTEGQSPPPDYFGYDAILNRRNRALLDEHEPPAALTLHDLWTAVDAGAVIVDGRTPEHFAAAHLRGAVNIGLEGRYAEFAGSVLASDVDIVLVTEPGRELEARNRLARIGFDRVVGHLADVDAVLAEHDDLVHSARRWTAEAFDERRSTGPDVQLVDVRNPGELSVGIIPGARSIPLRELPARLGELDPGMPTVVYCAGGYRSSVAASLLRRNGFGDVSDVLGGYDGWIARTRV